MTVEELAKITFRMIAHLAMEDEHCCTYSSPDGRLGFCDHTKKTGEFTYGRTYRHWRIDGKVYKSKEKFMDALKDFHPAMTMERLKEMQEGKQ